MLAFFLQRFFMTTLNPASNPWRDDAAVISLVGIAHASSHFSHLLLPLMFPVFISTFGLSYSELGFLMTVFFVVSGVGQATAGFVVDRLGARPVLFAALLLLAAGCMVVSVANSYVGLMLGRGFAGSWQLLVSPRGLHHPQSESVCSSLGLCLQCAWADW